MVRKQPKHDGFEDDDVLKDDNNNLEDIYRTYYEDVIFGDHDIVECGDGCRWGG